jgi:anti-sigma-K factor RskA
MTDRDDMIPPEGDDALAGEYALGVGDAVARADAQRRIATDPGFAARVAAWERRLSGLDDLIDPVAPPPRAFAGIEARLFTPRPGPLVRAWSSLALWRGLAVAGIAIAVLLGVPRILPNGPDTTPELVATIAERDGDLRFAARFAPDSRRLRMRQTEGAEAGSAADFELWLLVPGGNPVSLGLIGLASAEVILPVDLAALVDSGVTLAVSREPEGGSTTGQPTGPVVALGTAKAL